MSSSRRRRRSKPAAVGGGAAGVAGVSAAEGVFGKSVRALRPTAGQVRLKDYDNSRMRQRFGEICGALRAVPEVVQSDVTEREVARLTGRLLAFMDSALGLGAEEGDRALVTKFPVSLFFDYGAEGSLRVVVETCLKFKARKGWDGFDFKSPARKGELIEMLRKAEHALRSRRMLPVVKVFVTDALAGEERAGVEKILLDHGAVLVTAAEVATHVVYLDPPGRGEEDTDAQVLVRLLKSNRDRAYVHWYFHPDSYDDWIPVREVAGSAEPEPPARQGAAWHVGARWARDLKLFNEWMNERDYEMPLNFDGFVGGHQKFVEEERAIRQGLAARRVRTTVRLRLRMPEADMSSAPAAKRMREASTGVEFVGLPSVDSPQSTGRAAGAAGDALRIIPRSTLMKGEKGGPARRRPGYANWFESCSVHDVERRALPEFFSGMYASKNELVYLSTRNFIINTWARTPTKYLTVTAARRHLRGDASAIHRVHAFLEHWGLINYSVLPETRPQAVQTPCPPALPVFAGRCDPGHGRRRSILFLDNGSPADIHENRVRRVNIDGSERTRPEESLAIKEGRTGGLAHEQGEGAPLDSDAVQGMYPNGGMSTPNSRFLSADGAGPTSPLSGRRPLRSTRSSSRLRRVSRYTEDNSSEDDAFLDDDDDDSDDGEGVAAPQSSKADSAADTDNNSSHGDDVVEYHCDICAKDCTQVRYHNTQHADMDVCTDCFQEAKYPSTFQARDFIRMAAGHEGQDAADIPPIDPLLWSESENLLLLEALEIYGDNWTMIAEHVESKDQAQCVLQFLRLPIEDKFLDGIRHNWTEKSGSLSGTVQTPLEVVKKCVPPSLAVRSLTHGSTSLTGESVAFCDPMSTILPHAALLASDVPAEVIGAVLEDAGIFEGIADEAVTTELHPTQEECLTAVCYENALRKVPLVNDIPLTEKGEKATLAAIEHVRAYHDAAEKEVTHVAAADSPVAENKSKVLATDLTEEAAELLSKVYSGSGPIEDSLPGKKRSLAWVEEHVDPSPTKEGAVSGSTDDSPLRKKRVLVDAESSQSIAVASLASAALRAKRVLDVEDVELRRLYQLTHELKLEQIQMKVKHYAAICSHLSLAQAASSRQRMEAFAVEWAITKASKCNGLYEEHGVGPFHDPVGGKARAVRVGQKSDARPPMSGSVNVGTFIPMGVVNRGPSALNGGAQRHDSNPRPESVEALRQESLLSSRVTGVPHHPFPNSTNIMRHPLQNNAPSQSNVIVPSQHFPNGKPLHNQLGRPNGVYNGISHYRSVAK